MRCFSDVLKKTSHFDVFGDVSEKVKHLNNDASNDVSRPALTGGANEINVQMMVYNLDTKPFWRSEVDEIEKVDDISKQLPWFLECNPDRYPYWWAFLRFKINIVLC